MSSTINPPPAEDSRSSAATGSTGVADVADSTSTNRGHVDTPDSRDLLRQQKDRFGGMKFGTCFFGWLTATGTAVLLTGLLTAIGLGVGSNTGVTSTQVSQNADRIGLAGAIALLVVVLISYVAGGYVAGRMARFNGVRQGVGVWLWAIVVTIVLAVLGLVAGNRFNVLSRLSGQPNFSADGAMTTGAIITGILVVILALVGAILGGLAGMRYHRRVDKATFETTAV